MPPDTLSTALPGQPTRANLIGWMRTNLALMIFAFGLLSGGITTLVSTTAGVTRTQIKLDEQAEQIKHLQEEIPARIKQSNEDLSGKIQTNSNADQSAASGLQGAIADIERRFNSSENRFIDLRHARDAELAGYDKRIAVLENQMQYFRDHMAPIDPLGKKR